jgi:hypothetical protein
MSMILSPDVPLPRQSHRYEAKFAGAYSLREQVIMVLAVYGDDPKVVTDLIVASAAPLPVPLWSDDYDTFLAWRTVFEEAMSRMRMRVPDLDTF